MRTVRAILAVAMIVVGAIIVGRMVRYPIGAAFTGIVLGLAMIALGIVRLRMLASRARRS
ncbi:MAG TPA: hypothetical protein VMF11_02400 [Candidatus Baltobacteraceae bacterium]|nr:hypothetical protein [Candidatus Baltobacteraceae bacterium]